MSRSLPLAHLWRVISGIACGVDESGALLIEHHGTRQRILSGDVALRVAALESTP